MKQNADYLHLMNTTENEKKPDWKSFLKRDYKGRLTIGDMHMAQRIKGELEQVLEDYKFEPVCMDTLYMTGERVNAIVQKHYEKGELADFRVTTTNDYAVNVDLVPYQRIEQINITINLTT